MITRKFDDFVLLLRNLNLDYLADLLVEKLSEFCDVEYTVGIYIHA